MKETKVLKKEKGITLLALIITIIVLLILAMVSIKLVKDGAIIQHAKNATSIYSDEQIIEKVKLAYSATKLDSISAKYGFWSSEFENKLRENIQKSFPDSKVEVKQDKDDDENRIYSVIIDDLELIITEDGKVSKNITIESLLAKYNGRWIFAEGDERMVLYYGKGPSILNLQEEMQVVHLDENKKQIVSENEKINLLTDNVTISFFSSVGVEEINMNNLAVTLERDAFENCSDLKEIKNWSNAKVEADESGDKYLYFSGCEKIESIILPNDVNSVEGYAFEQCTNLKSVNIPNNVTKISEYAFKTCDKLTTINIDNTQGAITGAPWGTSATINWLR